MNAEFWIVLLGFKFDAFDVNIDSVRRFLQSCLLILSSVFNVSHLAVTILWLVYSAVVSFQSYVSNCIIWRSSMRWEKLSVLHKVTAMLLSNMIQNSMSLFVWSRKLVPVFNDILWPPVQLTSPLFLGLGRALSAERVVVEFCVSRSVALHLISFVGVASEVQITSTGVILINWLDRVYEIINQLKLTPRLFYLFGTS